MTTISAAPVTAWAIAVLEAAGLRSTDAATVANNLAYAELRGTSSHGFVRLGTYLDRIVDGGINAAHEPSVTWDLGALASLDGDAGPGAATAVHAVGLALDRAREFGIGCVLVHNANHFGAAAFYSELIADAGMLGIVSCNTDRAMCAPGGGSPVLGTNPLTIALPVPADGRPILDMATSEVSLGKVIVAAAAGEEIPLGWAVDESGSPTNSAENALHGALLPAAGPKGFGLSFMIDALVALGGGRTSPFVSALHGDSTRPQQLGQVFIAFRAPDEATGTFTEAIAALIAELRTSGLDESRPVLFPGEPELMRKTANGSRFAAPSELLESLAELSARFRVPLPSLD